MTALNLGSTDYADPPPMAVFNYRSNKNLLFANRKRKLIKELIVVNTRKLIDCLLSLQSSISPELKSKVVYKISCCGCNSTYVVQSVRYLTTRIDEYRKKDSFVGQHLRHCGNEGINAGKS